MKTLQQKITQLADADARLKRDLKAERSCRKVLHTAPMACVHVLIKS